MVAENGKNKAEALASVAKGNETVEWACSMPQLMQARHVPEAVYIDGIDVVGNSGVFAINRVLGIAEWLLRGIDECFAAVAFANMVCM